MEQKHQKKDDDKPAFVRAYERDLKREQEQNREGNTLADRLFNAVTNTPIQVQFEDAQGKFSVPIRRFTWSEQEQLIALTQQLSNLKTGKEASEATRQFFKLLAYPTGVCLSPELNISFWKKGQYDYGLPVKILAAARGQVNADLSAAESFRKAAARTVST